MGLNPAAGRGRKSQKKTTECLQVINQDKYIGRICYFLPPKLNASSAKVIGKESVDSVPS